MSFVHFIVLLICYLSGAVPFGFLLTRWFTGLNILEQGSGNIGSTNVGRIAGEKVARRVQILDMLKGLLPVLMLKLSDQEAMHSPDYFIYLAAFASIVGHNFSVFLRFRGGKGVNTTLGSSFLLVPVEVLSSVIVYFIVKSRYQFASAGSLALALTLPVAGACLQRNYLEMTYLVCCSLMIVIRHVPNIKRLLAGQENR
jgi:glycerol-3-phosphate acyltransferase PlsY